MKPHKDMLYHGLSVVVVGDFTPTTLRPGWLASQGLIRQLEADSAEIELIHREASIFEIDDWLRIEATRSKLVLKTQQVQYAEALRDLAIGILKVLKHTPITMFGINHDYDYVIHSEESWHSIGHQLAPKEIWQEFLDRPGMKSLSIQGERTDGNKGAIVVKVEPSRRIQPVSGDYGVAISLNDHYELDRDLLPPKPAQQVVALMAENWSEADNLADRIARRVASLGESS